MTQSAMCIPLWPARNGNTAHLVMCPFAGGSSSAFRHWQAEQLADCALSLVTWPCALSLAAAVARFATGKLSNWLIARFLW
ncbi:hypothetical protein [Escherichia coli]|uniref:hypothetical protein n=1 Tax=Escherichia coli TaxID=562 RepID=UPI000D5A1DAC|nr:hypothetical protein [Escherichia coli]